MRSHQNYFLSLFLLLLNGSSFYAVSLGEKVGEIFKQEIQKLDIGILKTNNEFKMLAHACASKLVSKKETIARFTAHYALLVFVHSLFLTSSHCKNNSLFQKDPFLEDSDFYNFLDEHNESGANFRRFFNLVRDNTLLIFNGRELSDLSPHIYVDQYEWELWLPSLQEIITQLTTQGALSLYWKNKKGKKHTQKGVDE